MDIGTTSIVFHSLSAAILALWAVQSTIEKSGTKGLFLAGMAMSMLGFGMPLAF